MIELKAPNGGEYVFAEILHNRNHVRFGIDIRVTNLPSEQMEVIGQNTIVYAPLKVIRDSIEADSYRLV